jgi:hypothetical protein
MDDRYAKCFESGDQSRNSNSYFSPSSCTVKSVEPRVATSWPSWLQVGHPKFLKSHDFWVKREGALSVASVTLSISRHPPQPTVLHCSHTACIFWGQLLPNLGKYHIWEWVKTLVPGWTFQKLPKMNRMVWDVNMVNPISV